MRFALTLILASFLVTPLHAYQPIRVMLGKPDETKQQAHITIHCRQTNGMSIIICPGGGYGGVVAGPEGNQIAVWLKSAGLPESSCNTDFHVDGMTFLLTMLGSS